MKITVKLFASFRVGRLAIAQKEFPEGTTVAKIVAEEGLPVKDMGATLVNGRHVGMEHVLNEGDTLAFFPLAGGG